MSIINKITSTLLSVNNKKFIIYCFLLSLLITLTSNIFANIFVEGELNIDNNLMKQHISVVFLIIVIILPFLETFLFQFSVIELGKMYMKNEKLILFLSAFIFAFFHLFNSESIVNKIVYFSITFLSGLIWAIIYSVAKKRKNVNPFLLIFLIHSFENLIGFIVNELK